MEDRCRTIRKEAFVRLFPHAPLFRVRQMERALFDGKTNGWEEVTTLSVPERRCLAASPEMRWMSLDAAGMFESRIDGTERAVLRSLDGARIETVCMKNARGHRSVCVSSQVGCAMACTFCATGALGFGRNLTPDEIVDQFRFWVDRLRRRREANGLGSDSRDCDLISNVVFMGMGEPLANYESVREALRMLLRYTSLGPTRITVSTVGLLPAMKRLLTDPLWPPVRLAVSLHSADPVKRKQLMPSSFDSFLDDLAVWTTEYFSREESRRRHLTFEYILLSGVNDSLRDAHALVDFSRRVGKVKINLIPYNKTTSGHSESAEAAISGFLAVLKQGGIVATVRRSRGDDIAAACGQLAARG